MQPSGEARRRAGAAAGCCCRGWTGRPGCRLRAARRGRNCWKRIALLGAMRFVRIMLSVILRLGAAVPARINQSMDGLIRLIKRGMSRHHACAIA